jgi:hypothetical protein
MRPDDELPELPAGIVVPDDARDLAPDLAALRAERAARRPRARWERLLLTRRWQRHGLSGPLVVLALAAVATIGSLVVVVLPDQSRIPTPRPLASPTIAAGRTGGLLPDVTLREESGAILRLREIRPVVLLLLSDACSCADLQRADAERLSRITVAYRLSVLIIGQSTSPPVPTATSRQRVRTAADPARAVAIALDPIVTDRPAAVLVRADGTIARVVPDVVVDGLGPELAAIAA